jgi:hypothetical protein
MPAISSANEFKCYVQATDNSFHIVFIDTGKLKHADERTVESAARYARRTTIKAGTHRRLGVRDVVECKKKTDSFRHYTARMREEDTPQ